MKTSDVESGLEEMDYRVSENSFGMEMASSKPAAFDFSDTPTKNLDGLKDELEKKGFGTHTDFQKDKPDSDRFYIDLEVYTQDYSKFTVKLWRETVRIYPGENGISKGELAQVTRAIETAFDAGLEHSPIE